MEKIAVTNNERTLQVVWYGGHLFEVQDMNGNAFDAFTVYPKGVDLRKWTPQEAVQIMIEHIENEL